MQGDSGRINRNTDVNAREKHDIEIIKGKKKSLEIVNKSCLPLRHKETE